MYYTTIELRAVMSEHELHQWLDAGRPPTELMGRCEICGERVWSHDDPAEMHEAKLDDPEMFSEARAGIVHAQCGLDNGWEVS
jgi:hypothetical protein